MKFQRNGLEEIFTIECSGRKFYANCGILGLSSDGVAPLQMTYGYDDGVDDEDFTTEEKKEIAEHMISLWAKYAGLSAPKLHPIAQKWLKNKGVNDLS